MIILLDQILNRGLLVVHLIDSHVTERGVDEVGYLFLF